ncbi:hypothetical protein TNIN_200461 [Trichonephila inaurata madagascariensis]|uniref:Uncharacterized protein n=1 Tax=Trichonephila inaurata madagascariensis TaxID=2747483 RepID=A0A8X6WLW9_9ARAC|nr:hypothetical protein TNIN_200461 [Trichonephila inaurata madagascariensis]
MELLSTNQIPKSIPQQPSKKFKHHMADAILQLKISSDVLHNISKGPDHNQLDCNVLKASMRPNLRRAMHQNIIPSIGKGFSSQNKRRRRSSARRSGKASRSKGRRRRSSGRSRRRRSSGKSKRRRSSGKSKRRRSRSKSKRKSSSGSKRRRQSRKHQGHIEGDGC